MNKRRGLGLLETVLACGVFSLLSFILFAIFFQGARAWRLGETRSDLHREAILVLHQIIHEVQQSHFESLTTGSKALGFFSARDSDGRFQTTSTGEPLWQKAVLFFLDPESGFRRRDMSLAAPQSAPNTVERTDFGFGLKPLSFYLEEGKVVARQVVDFRIDNSRPGFLEVNLDFEGGHSQKTSRWQVATQIALRNR